LPVSKIFFWRDIEKRRNVYVRIANDSTEFLASVCRTQVCGVAIRTIPHSLPITECVKSSEIKM
jgi:hypothetical protein